MPNPGAVFVRPGLPEAGYADHRQARAQRAQPLIAQVPALERAGAETFDQNVRLRLFDQAAEKFLARRLAKRKRNRFLVARKHFPIKRDAVLAAAEIAALVAALRVLHLDDLGPEVAQIHGYRRSRDHLPAINHHKAAERQVFTVRFVPHWAPQRLMFSDQARTRFAIPTIA